MGSLNANDTEGSEASHKTNMGLASQRVRHRRDNVTTTNMHNYLCSDVMYQGVSCLHERSVSQNHKSHINRSIKHGVRSFVSTVHMGDDLTSSRAQKYFLHPQVRLARVELLDMLCDKLQMSKTRESYSMLQCLSWTFGRKLVMPNGVVYWATDTDYLGDTDSSRRDVFRIHGSERCRQLETSFCCEAVVFVQISGWHLLLDAMPNRELPRYLAQDLDSDTLRFVLGRWLTDHPDSTRRDSTFRPVCPGPLEHTHCLWKYAKTTRPRKLMTTNGRPSAAFTACKDMFGSTHHAVYKKWDEEQRAYYTLLLTSTIVTTSQISREYIPGQMDLSDAWLETVTVV